MKKLFYLIVVIAALGLIVSGCIPMVPPVEQGETSSLMKGDPPDFFVDDDNCPGPGTGTESDPFCTIQAAINAATIPGEIIKVADGTYIITSKISVNIENITITGNVDCPENVVVQYSSPTTNSLIFDMRANDVTVEGIKTIGGKGGFFFDQSATGCKISHCIVENALESGIYIYNGSGHTVEYTTIINPGQMGNLFYSDGIYTRAANTTIDHCTISSDKVKYMKWGINLEDGYNHLVTENTITGAWQAAIRAASWWVRYVTITNNDIDDATEGYQYEAAISLAGHNDGSIISGNHIDDVVASSAIAAYNAWDITIANNRIGVDDPSNDVRLEGIRIEGCGGSGANRVEVTGNIINNTGFAAILLNGDSSNTYIYNNIITNCNNYGLDSTGDWDYASIHVNEYSDNVIVDGNDISDGINGIQVWGDSCTVTNNTVTDMGLTYEDSKTIGADTYWNSGIIIGGMPGIDVSPTGTVVQGNILTGNVVGLFVYHASNEAHFNNIEGNTNYGVYNEDTNVFDATRNWWGHASGPSGEYGRVNKQGKVIGKGDAVSDNVNWDPWLSQPIVPPTQILNKWDLEGTFIAHKGYNWGGLLENYATWEYSIHIKEAMSGEFSVGSIRFATVDNIVDINVIGIVEQTKTSYNYSSWANWDTFAAAGRAKYNGETYNFLFLFSEHAMWFAISHCNLEPYWTNEDVWHGLDREYDLLSKIPDETFIVDPKSIH